MTEPSSTSPEILYEQFLSERQRIVEARQRAQQRVDQLVTTGAAGALVLSITFMEKIAAQPHAWTQPLLVAGWCGLLASLGLNLASHYTSQAAFDSHLRSFDTAYVEGHPFQGRNPAHAVTRMLDMFSAALFVAGVALLAWFACANLTFKKVTSHASGAHSPPRALQSNSPAGTEPSALPTEPEPEPEPDAPTFPTSITPRTRR